MTGRKDASAWLTVLAAEGWDVRALLLCVIRILNPG